MGQNSSSTAFQNSSQPFFSRRKSHHPPPPIVAPPEATPPPPKSPTYVVAENKVLPNGVTDIIGARKLLRPVSQELSKFHPEYADIFQKPPNEAEDDGSSSMAEHLNASIDNKENSSVEVNTPRKLAQSKRMTNRGAHHIRNQSISSDNITNLYKSASTAHDTEFDPVNSQGGADSGINQVYGNVKTTSNLLRSQSMGLSASQPVNAPKHKRQISLASNSIQENVIPEDPREHLYNPARVVPFSNFQPSLTSLPVRSTFDIDYSLNLTYAQMAEVRRNKRINELEDRTSKKLGELEAEISASSNVPKSPFDLQNRGGKSSTHSLSTSSSTTGVSKSKKKKAPAPPPPPQVAAKTKVVTETCTVASEPPPDYDMKDTTPSVQPLQQGKFLQRSVSSASRNSKPPAPQPVLKSASSVSLARPESTGSKAVLPSSHLPASYVTLPRTGPARGQHAGVSSEETSVTSNVLVQQSIAQAKAQLEAMRKLQDILNKPTATEVHVKENDISHVSVSDDDAVVADLMNVVEKETALNKDTVFQAVSGHEVAQVGDMQHEPHQVNLRQPKADQPDIQQKHFQHPGTDQASTATVASHSMPSVLPRDKELTKRIDPLLQKDIILAALARKKKSHIQEPTSDNLTNPPSERLEESTKTKITKETEQNRDRSDGTTTSNYYTPQAKEDKAALQSDVLIVAKKSASSEFNKRSSTTVSSHITESEGTNYATSLDKFSDRRHQLEHSIDQEDRSSDMSIDLSKRSSIQSEDMSISSSNTSMRVFSPDWAPEHDLDSDDDIMDNSYAKTERRVSSEGFKASVVPPKVRDLHETPKNKSHKGNKKRNEPKEASMELPNDKSKFGSLRKFKNNVHQGMKNAFGSISKASGAVLNKPRARHLYDNPDTRSDNQSAEFDDNMPASFRNPNWMLSRSVDESLHRRTLSDGFFNQRSVNTEEHPDESENSEDDVGDIDFAGGINNIPTADSNPRGTKSAGPKEMLLKRTGVEYANGQIVLAVDKHDLGVNGHTKGDAGDFDEHPRKSHRKEKQYVNETASQSQEKHKLEAFLSKMIAEKEQQYENETASQSQKKHKLEAFLSKMIAEKEQQYENEMLRQQEIESDFRRLRDLEKQEILQRLQKEIAHEDISKLQRQQLIMRAGNEMNNNGGRMSSFNELGPRASGLSLNNSALNNLNSPTTEVGFSHKPLILSPVNDLGAPPSSAGINTAYINANKLSVPFQFLAHGNPTLLQTGYLDSPINFQNVITTGVQHSYNVPSLSTTAIGQSISPIGMTNANYMLPFFSGGGVNDGFTNKTTPKLTQQELVYLSEYMRKIGVPPPTSHHEWAVLLNSVSYNPSMLPMVGQNPGPIAFPIETHAPNLSSLLVNKNSFNDHTSKLALQITDVIPTQPSIHSNTTQPPQILQSNQTTTVPYQLQNYTNNPSLNPEHSQNTTSNSRMGTDVVRVAEIHPQPLSHASSSSSEDSTPNRTTETIASVEEHLIRGEHPTNTSTNAITKSDSQTVSGENFPQTSKVPTGASARTNFLPAKVYAPLGFRSVSFNPSPR